MAATRAAVFAALLCILGSATCKPKTKDYADRTDAQLGARQLKDLTLVSRRQLYNEWKAEYKKNIPAGQQDNERFAKWSANLDAIIANNLNAQHSFKGLNSFSDMTFEELKASRLMPPRNPADPRTNVPVPPDNPTSRRKLLATPLEFDWRDQNKVPPVRDQGNCGGCWAFAGIAAIETHALIEGTLTDTPTTNLAVQQILDCAHDSNGYWSFGCDGGYSQDGFLYTYDWWAGQDAAYPYNYSTGTCRSRPTVADAQPSWGDVKLTGVADDRGVAGVAPNASAIMDALVQYGPVTCYFSVQGTFGSYTSGVFQASECAPAWYNHAMLIVGFNATMGVGHPESYWILRNSWGAWGDGGYIKVQMVDDNTGACSMYSGLMRPLTTVAAAPGPSTASSTPPPSPSPSPPPPRPRPPPSPKPRPPPPRPPPPCGGKNKKCPPLPPLGNGGRRPPRPRPAPPPPSYRTLRAFMVGAARWRGFSGLPNKFNATTDKEHLLLTTGAQTQVAAVFRAGLADPAARYVRQVSFSNSALSRVRGRLLPPAAPSGSWRFEVAVNSKVLQPNDTATLPGLVTIKTVSAQSGLAARMVIITPTLRINVAVASKPTLQDQRRYGKWLDVEVLVRKDAVLAPPVGGLFGPSYPASRG